MKKMKGWNRGNAKSRGKGISNKIKNLDLGAQGKDYHEDGGGVGDGGTG